MLFAPERIKAQGIGWSDDPTNLSLDFERPRLRAARAGLDALGLTDPMLALSAGRLLRALRAVEKAVDRFCSAGEGAVTVHPSGFLTLDRVMLQAAGEEIAMRALGRAIAAAGGSDEPPSLGKLEIIAAGVLAPEAADATWTLARALVTGRGAVLTVEREPGREPFPVLELTSGAQATWDRRFRVSAGPAMSGPVEVRALGEAAAREVRQQAQTTIETTAQAPLSVARFVPGFWRGKSLLAAPSVDFWSEPDLREVLQSRFLGLKSIPRSAGEILK